MNWSDQPPGPKSKHDKKRPYIYEARVAVVEWDHAYNCYFSETICGLINYLRQKNINPEQVTIYEIYQDHETALETCYCIDSHDLWLSKPNLCLSLFEHCKGYLQDRYCSFKDRTQVACRP